MQKTILVVDDQRLIRATLKVSLRQLGEYRVLEASNGMEAFEVVQNTKIDLIFCDINMPESDGLDLLFQLSSSEFDGDIVLISGEDESLLSSTKSLVECYKLRILDVTPKPLTASKIRSYLKGVSSCAKPNVMQLPLIEESVLADHIQSNNVTAYFQLQVSLDSMKVVGFEALARIVSGDMIYCPSQFISTSEKSGLINELTKQVIESALHSFSELVNFESKLTLSLNISSKVLEDSDFPHWLSERAAFFGVPNTSIICELTETMISDDPTTVHVSLLRLRLLSFKVSIDDFGTGYATLTQLHSLPFSELKIDRRFVSDLLSNKNSLAVCVRCIALAKDFGLKVVAEGIEDEETLNKLLELGCDIGQGYYFGKPEIADLAIEKIKESACSLKS